ncbi:hypothetical protein MMC25_000998 [Agyrium rufum]|nr:hypothetical protein [Agyrium rufum]
MGPSTQGRVPEDVFKPVVCFFYALALGGAFARTIVRWKVNRAFAADDAFLAAAIVFMTASFVILWLSIPDIYLFQALSADPFAVVIPTDLMQRTSWFQESDKAYLAVAWTAIFSVKFGFLMFFRRLVDRLPKLATYWKIICAITGIFYIFCFIDGFVACPYNGMAAQACTHEPALTRVIILASFSIAADIISDLMIVMVPIWILWKVQMRMQQKLGLAIFLCLNLAQAFVGLIRVATIHYYGTIDQTWNYFWFHMEVVIAVMMISLTAFRSVFAANASRASREKNQSPGYKSSPWRKLRSSTKASKESDQPQNLPTIPSATMTGMRTFIRGGKRASTMDTEAGFNENGEDFLLDGRNEKILVTHEVATDASSGRKPSESSFV